MTNLDATLELLAVAKTIKGTSFVGVRNYENKQGEVTNQTINVGVTYINVLQNDFNSLQTNKDLVFDTLTKNYSKDLIEQAYFEVYNSLEKRLSDEVTKEELRANNDSTMNRSDAQINAYIHLTKGVKLHKEKEQIHIFGFVVKKTVLKAIEYKVINSKDLTKCKNEIQFLCKFKQSKYKTFIFNKADVKLQGIEIENN